MRGWRRLARRPIGAERPDAPILRIVAPDGCRRFIRVARATGFWSRLRGLVGRPAPASGHGLWIEPCAAIHTFGIAVALDVVFVSRGMVVQRVDAQVPPGGIRIAARARSVLELRAGEAARIGLETGVRLEWCRHGGVIGAPCGRSEEVQR